MTTVHLICYKHASPNLYAHHSIKSSVCGVELPYIDFVMTVAAVESLTTAKVADSCGCAVITELMTTAVDTLPTCIFFTTLFTRVKCPTEAASERSAEALGASKNASPPWDGVNVLPSTILFPGKIANPVELPRAPALKELWTMYGGEP